MNIVKLNPKLLEVNASIAAAAMPPGGLAGAMADGIEAPSILSAPLSGTVHNGYNAVTARIAPRTSGTIELSFDIVVLSISSLTFDLYRTVLKKVLEGATEKNIAQAAGIRPPPPPEPSSRMASYALQLLSDVVFDGELVSDQNRTFSAQDCTSSECLSMLTVTRLLKVTEVKFSGTLTASSESAATEQVAAYVPITSIEFDDRLTIPFAGYSDNVLVDDNGLKQFEIPGKFWSEK